MQQNELYHFGIKGQRWGVRRFQKKDGTLTSAGKDRYSDTDQAPKKSRHRQNLEANYRAKGMTKAEAEAAADKRIKIEKVIAITAGVTVAGCAAYYARNKYIADRTDQILKAGTTFHNLDAKANPRPGEHLYVNYRQNDRNFFNGHFSKGKIRRSGHVYEHKIEAIEDVKIPSLKTRKSVFKQLCEQDPEFREAMRKHSNSAATATPDQIYKRMWPKFGDKNTEYFNDAKHKYFKALQDKGYGAIVDEYDTRADVFRSDAPLILLNTSHKSLGEMKIRELKANDVLVAQANSHAYNFKTNMLTSVSAPHTNHFKESKRTLNRYAKIDQRNRVNIETALFKQKYENGLFGNAKYETIKNQALKGKGKELAYVGKYLNENRNMTLKEAQRKATLKMATRNLAEGTALLGASTAATYVPYAAVGYAANRAEINSYRKKHPNSKKTDEEILKMLQQG